MNENVTFIFEAHRGWGMDYEIAPGVSTDELSNAFAALIQLISANNTLLEAWDKALIKVEGTEYEPSE